MHNGRCRTDKSCAGSIATHPFGKLRAGSCKKRKDGAPSVGMVQCKDGPLASSRSSDCLHSSGQRQTQVLRIEGDTISWRAFLKATAFRERTGIYDIKTELIQ